MPNQAEVKERKKASWSIDLETGIASVLTPLDEKAEFNLSRLWVAGQVKDAEGKVLVEAKVKWSDLSDNQKNLFYYGVKQFLSDKVVSIVPSLRIAEMLKRFEAAVEGKLTISEGKVQVTEAEKKEAKEYSDKKKLILDITGILLLKNVFNSSLTPEQTQILNAYEAELKAQEEAKVQAEKAEEPVVDDDGGDDWVTETEETL